MRGIVFLDRDGTLIEEVGYLRDPSDVRILPGAAEALRLLSREGFLLAVVSNQAGLAKGKFSVEEMDSVHRRFLSAFDAVGVAFDAVEYCPHHPEGTLDAYRRACGCRKPGTGMAEAILQRLRVPDSCPRFVVGDKMSDVSMGVRLGAATVLVATGYGNAEKASGERAGIVPDIFLPGMREAAGWIVAHGTGS
ncbi:MAG: D-glycero-alpha-D-manno-heptose-1,7-bisphosphate 7-phosphatase [Actinomycetota bacterium]